MRISLKDTLVLFLIGSNPGVKNIRKLVMIFDRASFPGEVGNSIDTLADNGFIYVKTLFTNGTPLEYDISERGKLFLKDNFDENEMLQFINSLDDPTFLYELTKGYIEKV